MKRKATSTLIALLSQSEAQYKKRGNLARPEARKQARMQGPKLESRPRGDTKSKIAGQEARPKART